MSLKKTSLFLVGLLIALVALVAAGCGGSGGGSAPEALPSSSCTAIEYEGDGNPDYLLVSDLPLQGASRTQTLQINDAIRYQLKAAGFKAGDYKIGFQACDDATAQAGKWDSGKCSQNANAYAGERQGARDHRHVQLGLRRRSSSRSSTRRRTAGSRWSRRPTRTSA